MRTSANLKHASWSETLLAAHQRCRTALSAGAQLPTATQTERLIAAALCSDEDTLRSLSDFGKCDEDTFLFDWIGFWAWGAGWPGVTPLPAVPISDWAEEYAWIQHRRRAFAERSCAAEGYMALDYSNGPLRICARVNGVEGGFILDTGASSSLVRPGFARRAGVIPDGPERTVWDGSGASSVLVTARATHFEAGTWWAKNVPLDVLELTPSLDADGILSPFDLIDRNTISFDGPGSRLLIDQRDVAANIPVFWSEGVPSLRVRSDRGSHLMLLDTGAGGTVMISDGLDEPSFDTATAFGSASIARLGEFALTPEGCPSFTDTLYAKPMHVTKFQPLPRLLDGYLGTTWFRQYQVTFPKRRGRMHVAQPRGMQQ